MDMRYLSKENYQPISNWIENIIDSCDTKKKEQEKICDQLITNFTKQILSFNGDFNNYLRLERKLRRKLISKFYSE